MVKASGIVFYDNNIFKYFSLVRNVLHEPRYGIYFKTCRLTPHLTQILMYNQCIRCTAVGIYKGSVREGENHLLTAFPALSPSHKICIRNSLFLVFWCRRACNSSVVRAGVYYISYRISPRRHVVGSPVLF